MRPARLAPRLLLLLLIVAACQQQAPPAPTAPAPASTAGATGVPPSPSAPRPSPSATTLPSAPAVPPQDGTLQSLFAQTAAEFGVPEPILLSVSYNLSRWEQRSGETPTTGAYGLMHLPGSASLSGSCPRISGADFTGCPDEGDDKEADGNGDGAGEERLIYTPVTEQDDAETGAAPVLLDPGRPSLSAAAELLGLPELQLMQDERQSLRGGAALLARYARELEGELPQDPARWYGAVARYSGSLEAGIARDFADLVFATIGQGVERTTSAGERVRLAPQPIVPDVGGAERLGLVDTRQPGADCPPDLACQHIPASYVQISPEDPDDYANYDLAERPDDGMRIDYIVIHNAELPSHKTLLYFQQPWSYVSAHYTIRSDGLVTQQVDLSDIARTAGNWYINMHSINIEHEGYAIEGAAWYDERMYQASARLVRYLAERYGIPLDRAHIIGHDEVAGPTPARQTTMHWDPGPFWDWARYMELLGAPIVEQSGPGAEEIVTISPRFEENRPSLSYCTYRDCRPLPGQPSSALRLYSAPSFDSPPIDDPALEGPGSDRADDWGAQAATGQQFVRAGREGDWQAIWFGGQRAWLHSPGQVNTVPGAGMVVTPRAGLESIPVYGRPFPESVGYADAPLQYRIPAGQRYVAVDLLAGDEYAPVFGVERGRLIGGSQQFYRIFFNHRMAFVRAEDVELDSP